MTAQDMQPTITGQELAAARPGHQVQVTFEVTGVTALYAGELLDGQITDTIQPTRSPGTRRTAAPVRVRRGRDTPIVMGKPAHLTRVRSCACTASSSPAARSTPR
jgi:hypothetical protein